ncbi:MAG: restriction endonuclease [Candidatus Woesearchaeota archaeon]
MTLSFNKLTPEKVKGLQFEIFLELLLKHRGMHNVIRNVEYHKSRYKFRQIDLSYNYLESGKIKHVVVEAKYSSNCVVPYLFRQPRELENGNVIINGPVEQIIENRDFSGSDIGVLVTNKSFDDRIKSESEKRGIVIIEGDSLSKMLNFRQTSLDNYIRSINVQEYNLLASKIYV